MAFTTVTVTGSLTDSSGNPLPNARIQFSLTEPIVSTDTGTVASNAPETVSTDSSGNFSVALYATDDATTQPRGQVYVARILIPAGPESTQFSPNNSFPTYYFALPHAAAPTVSFATLIYSGLNINAGIQVYTAATISALPTTNVTAGSLGITADYHIRFWNGTSWVAGS
jgi:CubicO group peptidase (beta-lactamase class C family)